MKTTSLPAAMVAALFASHAYAATPTIPGGFMSTPTAEPTGLRALTKMGCYKSSEPMVNKGPHIYQTSGNCQKICYNLQASAMALANGTDCWCGNMLPPLDTKVDDAQCSTKCAGYPGENCGGAKVWSVYETGFTLNQVENLDKSTESPSASASASASPTGNKSDGGGSNTVGIVVGVIVGVIVVAAVAGGGFIYLRRKQQRELEEFKRQTDTQSFAKVEENRPSMWAADTRMESGPGRRMSSGSIDDNADYSRKILQVRNPDGF